MHIRFVCKRIYDYVEYYAPILMQLQCNWPSCRILLFSVLCRYSYLLVLYQSAVCTTVIFSIKTYVKGAEGQGMKHIPGIILAPACNLHSAVEPT